MLETLAKNKKALYLSLILALGGCDRREVYSDVPKNADISSISDVLRTKGMEDMFESHFASRCSLSDGSCVSSGGSGEFDGITNEDIFEDLKTVGSDEGSILFSVHNHPLRVFEKYSEFLKFKIIKPNQMLTGPSGVHDCFDTVGTIRSMYSSRSVGSKIINLNIKNKVNLVVDPGGIWVCTSWKIDVEKDIKKIERINELRVELIMASQNETGGYDDIVEKFILEMRRFGLDMIFLPTGASKEQIIDASKKLLQLN